MLRVKMRVTKTSGKFARKKQHGDGIVFSRRMTCWSSDFKADFFVEPWIWAVITRTSGLIDCCIYHIFLHLQDSLSLFKRCLSYWKKLLLQRRALEVPVDPHPGAKKGQGGRVGGWGEGRSEDGQKNRRENVEKTVFFFFESWCKFSPYSYV